jgi:hypothetical protein
VRLLVADSDVQSRPRRRDAEVAVAQASDEIERLAWRLLLREADGVVGDVFLDGITHLGRRSKVAVGGDETCESLVRTLKVVSVDVERQPPHVVGEVAEDGAAQKLVPECLPEALCLSERFRVLRSASDMASAVAP